MHWTGMLRESRGVCTTGEMSLWNCFERNTIFQRGDRRIGMDLRAEIDDQTKAVEVRRDGDRVYARIDDRDYELEVAEPEPGVFLLKHDGRIFEAYVTQSGNRSDPYKVRIGTQDFEIRLTDPKRLRGGGSGDHDSHGAAEIRAAMPGKIVRILTEVGAAVEKGTGVIVVEAMKMQNELKSPKPGTVKEIRGAEGSTVNAGDVLVVIE
jgi:biotin carboxyl carrier protein